MQLQPRFCSCGSTLNKLSNPGSCNYRTGNKSVPKTSMYIPEFQVVVEQHQQLWYKWDILQPSQKEPTERLKKKPKRPRRFVQSELSKGTSFISK